MKETKAENTSADRENGAQSGGSEDHRKKMTEEEIQRAIEYLKTLSGVKDNNLTVRLESREGINVVFIEDSTGKTVKRISERELSLLDTSQSTKKGQLLNKAL